MTDQARAGEFLGLWFSPDERLTAPTPEEVVPAMVVLLEKVRLDERARIVAWLRSGKSVVGPDTAFADLIERGEYAP